MYGFIAVVLGAVLVAGCASTNDLAAEAEREVERMIQIYGPACEKIGYKSDTDAWRDCIMRLSARDDMTRYGYYGPYFPPPWRPYWM